MKVIPAIDLIEGQCVRLFQGDYDKETRYRGDPLERARRFHQAGFSRLHVIDLEGARSGRGENREAIARLAADSGLSVQVGGGIRTDRDVEELLATGVDRLILGTVALTEPDKVSAWLTRWQAAQFMISLDLKMGRLQGEGWLRNLSVSLETVLERIGLWKVPEVICTVVERDGTLAGPDYETYQRLLARLPDDVGLLAAGGVSRPEHVALLSSMGVSGAVVGRALYEGSDALRHWSCQEVANVG